MRSCARVCPTTKPYDICPNQHIYTAIIVLAAASYSICAACAHAASKSASAACLFRHTVLHMAFSVTNLDARQVLDRVQGVLPAEGGHLHRHRSVDRKSSTTEAGSREEHRDGLGGQSLRHMCHLRSYSLEHALRHGPPVR